MKYALRSILSGEWFKENGGFCEDIAEAKQFEYEQIKGVLGLMWVGVQAVPIDKWLEKDIAKNQITFDNASKRSEVGI